MNSPYQVMTYFCSCNIWRSAIEAFMSLSFTNCGQIKTKNSFEINFVQNALNLFQPKQQLELIVAIVILAFQALCWYIALMRLYVLVWFMKGISITSISLLFKSLFGIWFPILQVFFNFDKTNLNTFKPHFPVIWHSFSSIGALEMQILVG